MAYRPAYRTEGKFDPSPKPLAADPKLIARVYETDPLQCGRCGGRMKIIAFVIEPSEIKKILAHLGLPTDTPKFHPARGPPQSDFWRSDLWENATASEWGVDPTYPDAADQDQSLHW